MLDFLSQLGFALTASAQAVGTSTIEQFGDALAAEGFDMLFWLLPYIFPILITVAVIAVVWVVVLGIVTMRSRGRK